MDVRCEKCETVYELEDARVPARGARVKCTTCGHIFRIYRPENPKEELPLPWVKGQTVELDLALRSALPQVEMPDRSQQETVKAVNPLTQTPPVVFEEVPQAAEVPQDVLPVEEVPQDEVAEEEPEPTPAHDFSPSFEADAPREDFEFQPRPQGAMDTAAVQAAAFPKRPWKSVLLVVLLGILAFLLFDLLRGNRRVLQVPSAFSVRPAPSDENPTPSQPKPLQDASVVEVVSPSLEDAGGTSVDASSPSLGLEDAGVAPPTEKASEVEDTPLYLSFRLLPEEKLMPGSKTLKTFAATFSAAEISRLDNKLQPAFKLYGKAAGMATHRLEPHVGRGLCWLGLGRWREAEASFLRALKANKKYAPALVGLAETYRLRGKNESAIKQFEKVLEAKPSGPEADMARKALDKLQKP